MEADGSEARGPVSSLLWTLLPCPALHPRKPYVCLLSDHRTLPSLESLFILSATQKLTPPPHTHSENLPTVYIVPSHPETYFVWP